MRVPSATVSGSKVVQARDDEELAPLAGELKRMLTALLQKLNADR